MAWNYSEDSEDFEDFGAKILPFLELMLGIIPRILISEILELTFDDVLVRKYSWQNMMKIQAQF